MEHFNGKTDKKILLDFHKTYSYFIDNIGCGKSLSVRTASRINYELGEFFTYLPVTVMKEKTHNFSSGNIHPLAYSAGPKKCNEHRNKEECELAINLTSEENISQLILDFLKEDPKHVAVFEDYFFNPETDPHFHSPLKLTTFDRTEAYYILDQESPIEHIRLAIKTCDIIWHFICVLTMVDFTIDPKVTDVQMDEIVKNAHYVICGAYDGEGYIVWKKINNSLVIKPCRKRD